MTNTQILWLVVMGLVFAVWAFFWFRTLFRLNRIASARRREQNLGPFQGFGITVQIFGEFLVRPEHRRDRQRLIVLTAIMFAIIFGRLWSMGSGI